jgi:hypothetical protein
MVIAHAPNTPVAERRAQLVEAAREGIAAAKSAGQADTLETLAGTYSREAARARLAATRIETERAFVAADAAHGQTTLQHGADLRTAQELTNGGLAVLSPRLVDQLEDPDELRALAAAFAELAEASR